MECLISKDVLPNGNVKVRYTQTALTTRDTARHHHHHDHADGPSGEYAKTKKEAAVP